MARIANTELHYNCEYVRRPFTITMSNKSISTRVCVVIISFTLSFTHQAASARTEYQIISLGTLGGNFSEALDVNVHGQIVGVSLTSANDIRAFVWNSGQMSELMHPFGTGECYARSINDLGAIVGYCNGSAVLWRDGQAILLPTIAGPSEATDINNDGDIVGTSYDANGISRAVIWRSAGQVTVISPAGQHARAFSINARGDVVGEITNGESTGAAFLFSNGRYQLISDVAYGLQTARINKHREVLLMQNGQGYWSDPSKTPIVPAGMSVFDLSDSGDYVGEFARLSLDETYTYLQPVIARNKKMVELPLTGDLYSARPNALNTRGLIVGYAQSNALAGQYVAVMWTR
jgi:probable HAF family extracellular repeat protein